jgi:uncharacterized protein (DUF1499 family)
VSVPERMERPNGVSSRATDPRRRVEPLEYRGTPERMRARVGEILGAWPRTRVVEATGDEWRVECRSRAFGFVDDLVLVFDDRSRRVEIASIARTGYWDLGVNRRRVAALRRALSESTP